MSTKVQPHIRACTKCLRYSPCPHPDLNEEEVHALIEFVKVVSEEMNISKKVEHVKKARQDRSHHCHWMGCERQVPPAMWGCKDHWYRLPKILRDRIWATYSPGQEKSMTPSRAYVIVAREVQDWIEAQELL